VSVDDRSMTLSAVLRLAGPISIPLAEIEHVERRSRRHRRL
jgi:hypothetical protein